MAGRFEVTSPAFRDGDRIPEAHTCDGVDTKPALRIVGLPDETISLAVIFDDPDSPHGTWVHWLSWDIRPEHAEWEAGEDLTVRGAREGKTSWNDRPPGYHGPCPGQGEHRYFFRVYALDTLLELPSGTDRETLERAMEGHVLAEATLIGRYIKRANRRVQ